MILAQNDSETPQQTCPTCGRPFPLPSLRPLRPWTPETSALLDLIVVMQENIDRLKDALEEVAL